MSRTKKSLLTGATVGAAAFAMMVGGTGFASASPVVSQSHGSCVWSADVVHIGGLPRDGYGTSWYIKTGRNDNTNAKCSFEVQAKFKLQSGQIETVQYGSSRPAHDQAFAKGAARVWSVGLKVCAEGQGCSAWNIQNSTWNR
ncbi:hypothetical protein [Nocardia sp. CS682]|uniref:hypothetical protein n=1 Tax=Nocardia sp. CS682 TaxID=1047172 RepID=UPI0010750F36|nr:hypothetical protein [Nocardia sp. CS682]QBS42763.1 hypothetical protein DMB37_24320 [Nocardia sp. CS682]